MTSADVNRDGRNDLVVGAPFTPGGGLAYVFSGRTFKLLYKILPPDPNHAFGYGTGMTEDVNRDHHPDLIVGGGGAASVFSGRDGHLLYSLPPSSAPRQFGTFFLAGVGDLNHDHVPDVYGADYGAADDGAAASRACTQAATARCCAPGPARPGTDSARAAARATSTATTSTTSRSAPTLNSDGGTDAGKIEIFSGRSGRKLRTITSTTPGENLGFDAVGIGDVNRDRKPDLLASAAEGDTLYVVAGR